MLLAALAVIEACYSPDSNRPITVTQHFSRCDQANFKPQINSLCLLRPVLLELSNLQFLDSAMKSPVAIFLLLVMGISLAAIFAPESSDPEHRHYPCQTPEKNSQNSAYILPYPVGAKYRVNQANCSGHGHSNFWNHGYDFVMDVGTPVLAAREGQIGWARDGCNDGDKGCTNLITIRHTDGTVALYSHLTNGGIQVQPGQHVKAGQIIGQSGNTGNTGGLPHLHFSSHPCNELPGLPDAGVCPTIPVNFRNTASNPKGLSAGQAYIAE